MSRGRLALTLGCFLTGVVLMVGFEATITRVLGMIALFAFIVSGVFLIADPAFLAEDEDEEQRVRRGRSG
jgi:glucose uptake protein GlcU